MELTFIVPLLALITMLVVILFALFSKKKVEKRRHEANTTTSTLAKDGPQDGVDLLKEDAGRA